MKKAQEALFEAVNSIALHHKMNFLSKSIILDLICYNFRNAMTCCYFADKDLNVVFVNSNLKHTFNLENNIKDDTTLFQLYKMIGIPQNTIEDIKKSLYFDNQVSIPSIPLETPKGPRNFSLITTKTSYRGISFLEGVQGQFICRTDEHTYLSTLRDIDKYLKGITNESTDDIKIHLNKMIR